MAITVFFSVGVIGNFLWALLGLLLVLAAPRPFLWWPVQPQHSDTALQEISDTEPSGLGMNAPAPNLNTVLPAALLSSPGDVVASLPEEEDEEMQVVQVTAESLSVAAGGSRFEQAVAVGDAIAALRASRGAVAASSAAEFETAVLGLGETRQLPPVRPSSVLGFSLQAVRANREASLQLLATAHPHTANLKLDAAAEWIPACLVDADEVSFTPCRTQGAGGACAMRSVFGWPQLGSFAHDAPRVLARSLLGPSLAALRHKISKEMEMTLQRVTWREFLLPYVRSCPGREATCFARALKRMRPELLREMSALVQATTPEDRRYINAKMAVEAAARSLFCVEAEKHFIRPVAVSLGLLPNITTDFLHYTAAELQHQATLWVDGPFDFLEEAS